MKISAVIVAAGASSRMNTEISKMLININGKTVIKRTLEAFENSKKISKIIVVCRPEDKKKIEKEAIGFLKVKSIVEGGDDRQASVSRGVMAAGECDYIAIHDGARPLVTTEEIDKVCKDALIHGSASLAVKVKDTIKVGDKEGFVESTPNRDFLYQVQTPQVFKQQEYITALTIAESLGKNYTDDCQLIESCGGKVFLSIGGYTNIKLTTKDDIAVAIAFTGSRNNMRIGHGYDVHKLVENRKLIIGGAVIPNNKGLIGHSDADVLLHAITDSLLGATAMGDIGGIFPDTDSKFKDADSIILLKIVVGKIEEKGYKIENIDSTVIAQNPKLKPYVEQMRNNIALACNIAMDCVNVKATTEENLGFTGSEEGIAAHAVCLLTKY